MILSKFPSCIIMLVVLSMCFTPSHNFMPKLNLGTIPHPTINTDLHYVTPSGYRSHLLGEHYVVSSRDLCGRGSRDMRLFTKKKKQNTGDKRKRFSNKRQVRDDVKRCLLLNDDKVVQFIYKQYLFM